MRTRSILTVLALLTAWASPALAGGGPSPHKIDETITIAAPPAKVWALIGNFASLAQWHPQVVSSLVKGGNAPDATRTVVLKNGGTLTESLDTYNAKAMTYTYRLYDEDIKAFPVSSYFDSLSVHSHGKGSVVEWIGRFYRGDTDNEPAANEGDEASIKAMTHFFKVGLANVKVLAEHQKTLASR